MELQKWKVFKYIDSHFAADVKRAYLVGISSSDDSVFEIEREGNTIFRRHLFIKLPVQCLSKHIINLIVPVLRSIASCVPVGYIMLVYG